jgi:hypothetical protein
MLMGYIAIDHCRATHGSHTSNDSYWVSSNTCIILLNGYPSCVNEIVLLWAVRILPRSAKVDVRAPVTIGTTLHSIAVALLS